MPDKPTRVIGWTDFCSESYPEYRLNTDLGYEDAKREYDEAIDAIIKALRDNSYHWDGFTHQGANFGAPVLDTGEKLTFSYRGWGSIMAQAYPDEIDNSDGMGYCEWAWLARKENEHLIKTPPKSEWMD